ncbi:addiction module antidote protein, HigA family [Flavobacterium degerlachei]|jgi:addiction module HigA family antidote|uniref:Addiction module antidote protein, HigA family n=2 Tax=Flavobacterium degerlachei TaxID=229203 RepID=A0A1H3GUQ3_9FLAO|nr:addiction module antidote protein, HigA family [Flavobacterium degerlachei]
MIPKMRNVHPGAILKMELVEGRKLSVSEISKMLDTTETNISKILNGYASISHNMALKIEAVFGVSAAFFMRLQATYDLEEASKLQA